MQETAQGQLDSLDTFRHLGKRTLWFMVFKRAGLSLVGILAALILFFLEKSVLGVWVGEHMPVHLFAIAVWVLLASLVYFGIVFFGVWLWYHFYEFRLSDHALEIRRGILTKEETSVPFRQIQDINLERSLLFQMVGLTELKVITAGREEDGDTDDTEEVLPALDKNLASLLRADLLRRANIQEIISHGNVPKQNTDTNTLASSQ
jgi:uncharacterized membrane protein YdbT with pleckstrin-like domain